MSWESGGGGDHAKKRITTLLGPYEPLIMKIQSLLVWEYPWKSTILFVATHLLFWFMYVSSMRLFFIVSLILMVVVFVDTWKNRIWPEIRVPPKEPEDKDGWTPVHARLLSVPEISSMMCGISEWLRNVFQYLLSSRSSHPLVFCLGTSAFFTTTAIVGCHISGFTLIYFTTMGLMLWPCMIYHSLLSKAFVKLEPALQWLRQNISDKLGSVLAKLKQASPNFPNLSQMSGRGVEEEFVPQDNQEVSSALSWEHDDDNGNNSTTIPTPGLSLSPSLNSSDDGDWLPQDGVGEFSLQVNQMPSFDDLDNTDDELDLPPSSSSRPNSRRQSRLRELQFKSGHFGESDSEDEFTLNSKSTSRSTKDTNNSNADEANADSLQSGLISLGGAFLSTLAKGDEKNSHNNSGVGRAVQQAKNEFVSRALSNMMDSALQGVNYLVQGQAASSSNVIPQTGAKITYTCTEEGESIDIQKPQATILESEEEEEDVSDLEIDDNDSRQHMEHIAEIEKDFDFLHDIE